MPNKNKNKRSIRKPGSAKQRAGKKTRATAAKKGAAAEINARQPSAPAAVLDSQKLRELYSTMLKCRMLDEKARELAAAPERTPAAREAMLVGAAAHAIDGDSTIAATEELLAGFIRSGKPGPLPARRAQTHGAIGQRTAEGPPAQLALEKALAQAHEVKGQKKVVLVFCGAGAGAAWQHDSLALAARQKLPLVCLAETSFSLLAAATGRRSQGGAGEAGAPGVASNMDSHFPQIAVDGNDVVAVFRVAQEAVRRARSGHGPSLIQCVMPPSQGAHDPLTFMERYLRRRKLWSTEWKKKIAEDFRAEMGTAL